MTQGVEILFSKVVDEGTFFAEKEKFYEQDLMEKPSSHKRLRRIEGFSLLVVEMKWGRKTGSRGKAIDQKSHSWLSVVILKVPSIGNKAPLHFELP